MTPSSPLKAHHRLMVRLCELDHKKYRPRPEELEKVASVFKVAGGSWYRLFSGSVQDAALLKKVLSTAVKRGEITKRPSWRG